MGTGRREHACHQAYFHRADGGPIWEKGAEHTGAADAKADRKGGGYAEGERALGSHEGTRDDSLSATHRGIGVHVYMYGTMRVCTEAARVLPREVPRVRCVVCGLLRSPELAL